MNRDRCSKAARPGRRAALPVAGWARRVVVTMGLGCASLLAHAADVAPMRPLVYAMYADIKDWDPSISASTEVVMLSNVYETLVTYSAATEKVTPALATSWRSTADGKTWTFTLRKGVHFHDGSVFDAAVAKASIERTIKLGKGSSFIWSAVDSIKVLDPFTLQIHTRTPTSIDLVASAQYAAYMISPKAMAAGTAWFDQGHDGGSGPYTVTNWARGQQVVLQRFEGYWGGWKPGQLQQVSLRVVQEASTQTQLIRSGEADFITLPSADLVRALARDPAISVLQGPSWRNTQFLFNTQKAPTSNLAFRRALAMAWDYAAVVDKVYTGGASVASGVIPQSMWAHDGSLVKPKLDLVAARRLLESSGVPKDQWRLTASYISTSEEYKNSLLIFKANLEKLGVTLDLRPGPWGKIWEDAKHLESAPNMISMTWWPSYPTPSDSLMGLFHTENPTVFNLSHYGNPKFDALVESGQALESIDRRAAAAKYDAAQQILLDDAVAIFVADMKGRQIFRRSVHGVVINPAYDAVNFYALSR